VKLRFEKVYEFLLCLQVCSIICIPEISSWVLSLTIPILILGGFMHKLHFKFNFNLIPFVCIYLAYAIYILKTKHLELALNYLEYKFVFMYLPLVFLFKPKRSPQIITIYKSIVLSASILSAYYIVHALFLFNLSHSFNSFYASQFSIVHHPTYASLYFFTSLLILYYIPLFKKANTYINMVLAILGIYFCLSLAAFIFLIMWLLFLGITWLNSKSYVWIKWLLIPLSILLFYIIFNFVPHVEGEWKNATWFANAYVKNPDAFLKDRTVGLTGTEARIVLWTASFKIIKQHPWGVGTGNVDEALNIQLQTMKQFELAQKNYNPHNQYLQTAIEIGLPGLGLLLWLLMSALVFAFKHKHKVLFWFTLNLAFNMLFESLLQKQSGIVFSTMILCLIFVFNSHQKNTLKNNV
jgi:O-antigen ligase